MYKRDTHFHFIGIGGIGMSGIAKILIQKGYQVSGCDKNVDQKSVRDLLDLGCDIAGEHNSVLCHNSSICVVVYSSDIDPKNPEFIHAQQKNIHIVHRATILAELMKQAYSIGVAGSHGKTTTTSLIGHIFIEALYDPTVIVGGYVQNMQSNARYGSSKFLIAETDESDRSLTNLFPSIAVLTNIDLEHMNTYKNLQDVTATFEIFLKKLPFYGTAIVCYDDAQIRTLLPLEKIQTITYGISQESKNADITLTNLKLYPNHTTYTLVLKKTGETYPVILAMPGEHNAANSLGALAAAYTAGIDWQTAIGALATFGGVDRRFTYKGKFHNLEVFDDYGHHPTEIGCTIKNAIRYANGNPVTMIFQPHRYTRTHSLWENFIDLFCTSIVDNLIITDIYAAHETPIDHISSSELVTAIKKRKPDCNVSYVPYEENYTQLLASLENYRANNGVLLIQGAGPVTKIAHVLTA